MVSPIPFPFGSDDLKYSLIHRLRARAAIPSTKTLYTDAVLGIWIDEALTAHDSTMTYDTLTEEHHEPVLILAHRTYARSRHGDSASKEQVLTADGKSVTPHTDTWLDLIKELTDAYDEAIENLGVPDAEVVPGILLRGDPVTDKTVPTTVHAAPMPVSGLKMYAKTASTVTLSWVPLAISDFYRYRVYRATSTPIFDPSTAWDTSKNHKGVSSAAVHVKDINVQQAAGVLVEGLSAGDNYFVIVAENADGKISVSREVKVTLP